MAIEWGCYWLGHYEPTALEWYEVGVINSLKKAVSSGKIDVESTVIKDMISKKKEQLVRDIYKKTHPRAKGFYLMGDGRWRSRSPDLYAHSEDELLEKLYDYYFKHDMEASFKSWVAYRAKYNLVSSKTIEEDLSYWKRIISKEPLAQCSLDEIRPVDIYSMFVRWTGQGKITRKEFHNRKSVLNGIFSQAILDGIITSNPISSIPTSGLKFKAPNRRKSKAYSLEQRQKMLNYLRELPQDAYTLAIQLAFHGIFRVGEIKALKSSSLEDGYIWIEQQIVDEHEIILKGDEVTVGKPITTVKAPKGNQEYSIRPCILTPEAKRIINEMQEINPDGEFLFMHEGHQLTTDTVNRRLRAYTKAVGIPYLSSHKIRFTSASMLYQEGNMSLTDLSYLMGHSNTQMTAHYAEQRIKKLDESKVIETLG
jgi:integrase